MIAGGVELPRTELRASVQVELAKAGLTASVVLITGESGTGKSALTLSTAQALDLTSDEFQHVALNLRRVPETVSRLSSDLGMPLRAVLSEMTAKSRVLIVDAADGRTIAGHETMTPRPVASTTKIMTAWLLVRLADEHPEVLDEIITMSTRADEMRGSTAGLRAGESISVHEGLFGLLLPSGNDMSIALAEHFGVRLAAASAPATTEADPLCMFIAAMNAEAARLGMMETHFTNPHGLHEESHVSTANDLALLARATLASQSFRRYCSARQRGAVVHGPDGGARNVLWKNTNKLLATEGYDGIKTGTTEQAGACLVSTGERNSKRLIIVVLGSAASESCYTDARNLYRWGWQQLAAAVD